MKFQTIKDCIDSFMDGYSFSEAVLDATNAYRESKESLEALFDEQLWVGDDYEFDNDTDKQYYIALSRIEEALVHSELIYND